MTENHIVNSDLYWNTRFAENWDASHGPSQSRFFARIAIDHLPRWLTEQLKRQSLTLADWGCAQGDGTDVWASYIDSQQIAGIDFSSVAINQATQRYPAIRFINEDWLADAGDQGDTYDVVFSSNTLEHFHKPYDVLQALCKRARRAVVLALPYRELERHYEHFFTFLPENIPSVLPNAFRLVWSQVVDCKPYPKQWPGDQVILVYAEPTWVDSLCLKLSDYRIEQDDTARLMALVSDYEGQIASLNHQIAELNVISHSKDAEILKLKSSTSWLLTRPLRFMKRFFQNPKKSTYDLAKFVYWRLPPTIRQALQGPRHMFVRWVRGLPSPVRVYRNLNRGNTPDLSWKDFSSQVLSRRSEYKGVFVQELVIDWNVPLYQRPQHISAALGRLGYLVIYRTDNWAGDNVDGFREVSKNVWITNRHEVNKIVGVVRSFYSTAYAHTPELLLENGKRGLLVYEYIDHIDPQISGDPENIRRLLALKDFAFGGGVDYVVASSRILEQEAIEAVGRDKVILVQNGVDTRHYRNPIHLSTPLPENLISFREKYSNIIGYFGAIAPWLWYEAITELVQARPDLGFVFIGPDYNGGVEKLPKAKNVLYLGTVDYNVLPAYSRQFDVCFIPFAPGEIARTTSPLKLFEYFALEKPVVVTSEMLECVAFEEVFSGDSSRALSQAIDAAVQIKNDLEFRARLAQLADENDWDERARAMEAVFTGKANKVRLNDVQNLIVQCHKEDGLNQKYYEDEYKLQEELYWHPAPQWIMGLPTVNAAIDVGAAYGTLLAYTALNKQASILHAVDPVGYMSKSLIDRFNIATHPMDFERCDIDVSEKFDLVIFTEVIEHLNFSPVPTLLKLKKLMSKNGRLIVTTPDAQEWGRVKKYYSQLNQIPVYSGQDSLWIDGHIWQYTKDEIETVFRQAGLEVEKFDYSPGVAGRHLCYLLKSAD